MAVSIRQIHPVFVMRRTTVAGDGPTAEQVQAA